ncbi:serine/threonine-protein kinase [Ferruginibacter paludis]|uniref:serine/threonine-protein kinase n=1 Tax=Ferruginibacter paludis TaxID=1310417 RepID=UPI0025B600A6|nr:serine/threonine-protein kinase [Ferruginibacter paludis]MDN3657118.1 serine/threonine-protein kinase [Ferruginibacter paludis]
MAKVFTITEGLENLGALKSGGQGSVYKARKTGEIITAIKIIPTPIASETEDDKHFASFQNEVQKLKKVNEIPNPNVVSIIASGITSSGNLPYIEMEYIEGPDLGELLKPPYEPVFTVKETIKVADQLANALAHCHRANIKHGDIKSNNVKFNQRTGNYMLLDFGLSVMSDEQRRTSIRYAGAIEFMAPEQSSGETLFETDVYSFGIILFELLAGIVPFPLTNKGEMARNAVMLAHMETLPPDIITLRREAISDLWNSEKQEREMQIPLWLITMIYKCLEKSPSKRFKNGSELQEFIHEGALAEERKKNIPVSVIQAPIMSIDELTWRSQINNLQNQLAAKEALLSELQYQVEAKDKELYHSSLKKRGGISKPLFFVVLLVALGLTGFTAYNKFYNPGKENQAEVGAQLNDKPPIIPADSSLVAANKPDKKIKNKWAKNASATTGEHLKPVKKTGVTGDSTSHRKKHHAINEYEVINTAYFYDMPDKTTRRNVYLTSGSVNFTTLDEKNDFVYVEIKGDDGTKTRGWLLKKDFIPANDY